MPRDVQKSPALCEDAIDREEI
ncbi:hypothetical protein IL54_0120 [Sphingobium sp. ba1]|nr:hypothetical protein IL54_0120 [Sphingobium sp. ba1]